ncbi:voltage-dependent calcium channel gamma-7 subunit isoform X1 [Cavia porcellus]|uniref:voltage-dependent calcium channel gamma-7 subunit isoform X1 n=1 Tax=Cavia porcellus TaxID=10141 RepID=UPI002FDFBB88
MSHCSSRALTLLSSVFGACGLLLVGIAVSTDYWLYMEEGTVLPQNQTTEVKMALHAGLWRVCFFAGREKGRCVASEYFLEPEINLVTENTENILNGAHGHALPHGQLVPGVHRLRHQQHWPHPPAENHPGLCFWHLLHPLRPLPGGGLGSLYLQHQRRGHEPAQQLRAVFSLSLRVVICFCCLLLSAQRGGRCDVGVPVHQALRRGGDVPPASGILPSSAQRLLRLLWPVPAARGLAPRPQPFGHLQRRLHPDDAELSPSHQVPGPPAHLHLALLRPAKPRPLHLAFLLCPPRPRPPGCHGSAAPHSHQRAKGARQPHH